MQDGAGGLDGCYGVAEDSGLGDGEAFEGVDGVVLAGEEDVAFGGGVDLLFFVVFAGFVLGTADKAGVLAGQLAGVDA